MSTSEHSCIKTLVYKTNKVIDMTIWLYTWEITTSRSLIECNKIIEILIWHTTIILKPFEHLRLSKITL